MIVYDVKFNVDAKELEGVVKTLDREMQKVTASQSLGNISETLHSARAAGELLKTTLRKATTVDGVSMSRFNAELIKAGTNASQMARLFTSNNMTQHMNELVKSISSASTHVGVLNEGFKEMRRVLEQSVKYRAAMQAQDFVLKQAQEAVRWTRELNKSLTAIQTVSQKTGAEMGRVFDLAISKSKELRTTAQQYADASLIFYQQGLADQEVERRTDITVKAARAAGDSAQSMADQLTAVWNTYQMAGDELERAASIAAKLGASTAVDFKYITDGMKIAAVAGAQMGVEYESLASIIATVGEASRQSASTVSTAYKTIFSRFYDLKSAGTDGEVTLGKLSSELGELGINILDASGELKELDDVIMSTGQNWTNYSKKQQLAIAQLVGGRRQYASFLALMNNFDGYLENMSLARAEKGAETLEAQFAISSKTVEVYAEEAAEAWSRAFYKVTNENVQKNMYATLREMGKATEGIISSLGGIPGILAIIGAAFSKEIIQNLGAVAATIRDIRDPGAALTRQRAQLEQFSSIQREGGDIGGAIATSHRARDIEDNARLNELIAHGNELQRGRALSTKENLSDLRDTLETVMRETVELEKQSQMMSRPSGAPARDVALKEAAEEMRSLAIDVADGAEVSEEKVANLKNLLLEAFAGIESIETILTNIEGLSVETLEGNLAPITDFIKDMLKDDPASLVGAIGKASKETTTEIQALEKAIAEAEEKRRALIEAGDSAGRGYLKVDKKAKATRAGDERDKLDKQAFNLLQDHLNKEKEAAEVTKDLAEKTELLKEAREQANRETEETVRLNEAEIKGVIAAGENLNSTLQTLRTTAQLKEQINSLGPIELDMRFALESLAKTTVGVTTFSTSMGSLIEQLHSGDVSISSLVGSLSVLATSGLSAARTFSRLKEHLGSVTGKEIQAVTALLALKKKDIDLEEARGIAKKLGLKVSKDAEAAAIKKAIIESRLIKTQGDLNDEIALNTILTKLNAQAMKLHPFMWIAGIIMGVVAAFTLVNKAMEIHAKKVRESAERSKEFFDTYQENKAVARDLAEEMAEVTHGYEEARKSGQGLAAAQEDLNSKLDGVRAAYAKLNIPQHTLDILKSAEMIAKATGNWEEYYEILQDIQGLVGEGEESAAIASVGATAKDMRLEFAKGGGRTRGGYLAISQGKGQLSREEQEIIEASSLYAGKRRYGQDWGNLYEFAQESLQLDFSDPKELAKGIQEIERLMRELTDAGEQGGVAFKNLAEAYSRLKSGKSDLDQVFPVLEAKEFRTLSEEISKRISFSPGAMSSVAEYRERLEELVKVIEKLRPNLSEGEVKSFAEQFLGQFEDGSKLEGQAALLDRALEGARLSQTSGFLRNISEAEAQERAVKSALDLMGEFDKKVKLGFGDIRAGEADIEKVAETLGLAGKEFDDFVNSGKTYREVMQDIEENFKGKLSEEWLSGSKEYLEELRKTLERVENDFKNSDLTKLVTDFFDGLSDEDKTLFAVIDIDKEPTEENLNAALERARAKVEIAGLGVRLSADEDSEQRDRFALSDTAYSGFIKESGKESVEVLKQSEDWKKAEKSIEQSSEKIGKTYGKTREWMQKYIKDQEKDLKKLEQDHREAGERIAKGTLVAADGFNIAEKALEKYGKAIKSGTKAGEDFHEGVAELRVGVSKLLGLSDESLSDVFFEDLDNIDLVEKFLGGDDSAFEQLKLAAANDIKLRIDDALAEEDLVSFNNAMKHLFDIDGDGVIIGVAADVDTEAAEEAFNKLITSGAMTAEAVAAQLGSMGVDAEVVSDLKPVKQDIPNIVTEEDVQQGASKEIDGITHTTIRKVTRTFQDGTTPITSEIPIDSIKITSKEGSSGGNIRKSAKSMVNRGGSTGTPKKGGGGAGGKSSKPKEPPKREKDSQKIEPLERQNRELERLTRNLGKAERAWNRLNAVEYVGQKQADLLGEQTENLEKQRKTVLKMIETANKHDLQWARADLLNMGIGISFDNQGNILGEDEFYAKAMNDFQWAVNQHGEYLSRMPTMWEEGIEKYVFALAEDAEGNEIEFPWDLFDDKFTEAELDSIKRQADQVRELVQKYITNKGNLEGVEDEIQDYVDNLFKIDLEIRASALAQATQLSRDIDKVFEQIISSRDFYNEVIYTQGARIFKDSEGGLFGGDLFSLNNLNMLRRNFESIEGTADAWAERSGNKLKQYAEIIDRLGDDFSQYSVEEWDMVESVLLEARDAAQAWKETNDQIMESVSLLAQEWEEAIGRSFDQFDRYKSQIDSMRTILELAGPMYNHGKGRKEMQKLIESQMKVSSSQLAAAKEWKESSAQAVEDQKDAIRRYEETRYQPGSMITDEVFQQTMSQMGETLYELEQMAEDASENFYQSWIEALEDIHDYYEMTIGNIIHDMELAFFGEEGQNWFETQYDYAQELGDRYLIPVTKTKELVQLERELLDIETDQASLQAELDKLVSDVNKSKEEGVKLTQFDLDVLKDRAALIKAQADWEDARAAKNTMRLARTASGGFSYVYSSDPQQVADAQQEIENLLTASLERSTNRQDELLSHSLNLQKEYLADMHRIATEEADNPFLEEMLAERTEQFEEQMRWVQDQYRIATGATTVILETLSSRQIEQMEGVQRIAASTTEDYKTDMEKKIEAMIMGDEQFESTVKIAKEGTAEMINAARELGANVDSAMKIAGTSTKQLGQDFRVVASNIVTDSNRTKNAIVDMASAANKALKSQMDMVGEWSEKYVRSVEDVIAEVTHLYNLLTDDRAKEAGIALRGNAGSGGFTGVDSVDINRDYLAEIMGLVESHRISTKGDSTYEAWKELYSGKGAHSKEFNKLLSMRGSAVEARRARGENVKSNREIEDILRQGNIGWELDPATKGGGYWVKWDPNKGKNGERVPLDTPMFLDSGGYIKEPTHAVIGENKPEIVLNPEDTKNLLQAVNTMRDLVRMRIHQNLGGLARGLDVIMPAAGGDSLDQNVIIQADFPNVSDSREIQEAFNNLINEAAQYRIKPRM